MVLMRLILLALVWDIAGYFIPQLPRAASATEAATKQTKRTRKRTRRKRSTQRKRHRVRRSRKKVSKRKRSRPRRRKVGWRWKYYSQVGAQFWQDPVKFQNANSGDILELNSQNMGISVGVGLNYYGMRNVLEADLAWIRFESEIGLTASQELEYPDFEYPKQTRTFSAYQTNLAWRYRLTKINEVGVFFQYALNNYNWPTPALPTYGVESGWSTRFAYGFESVLGDEPFRFQTRIGSYIHPFHMFLSVGVRYIF